jgi:FkbM family methyltransferase
MNSINKVIRKIRSLYFPTEHQKIVKKYSSDGGDSKFRYNYHLNEYSTVFDIGGYKGQWASDIFSRYQSHIYIFEPVNSFYLSIKDRFKLNSKIKFFNFGLGAKTREEYINLSEDGSSIYVKGENFEKISIVNFVDFLTEHNINNIELIKMNIEGGEYELLEDILNSGKIKNIKNIQIQFHNLVPDAYERMLKIQTHLALTHRLTYQYIFVWENWEKIED